MEQLQRWPLSPLLSFFCFVLGSWRAAGDGGLTDDEKLQVSDGSWHRAQRPRVPFESACYYSYEKELPLGCQYNKSKSPEWSGQLFRERERSVLMQFYESTNGDEWRYNDNWGEGDPCWDFWYGITCDEHGYVIYIELQDNRVKGTMPANFGLLTQLLKIDISSTWFYYMGHKNKDVNRVRGAFPTLKYCSRISEIEISYNAFDSLPDDLDENANSLRLLSAAGNQLTKFPQNIKRFKFLHHLDLDRNFISEVFPEGLGAMTNMRVLQLSYNDIRGPLPESVKNLRKVEIFDISHNPFLDGELPKSIMVEWSYNKYISLLNTSISGYLNGLCSDVPFCWKFMYDTHADMTWAVAAEVPDLVNVTMHLAIHGELP